jgi:hypothetical protein
LHASPFVLTWNLYAEVPGLQGTDRAIRLVLKMSSVSSFTFQHASTLTLICIPSNLCLLPSMQRLATPHTYLFLHPEALPQHHRMEGPHPLPPPSWTTSPTAARRRNLKAPPPMSSLPRRSCPTAQRSSLSLPPGRTPSPPPPGLTTSPTTAKRPFPIVVARMPSSPPPPSGPPLSSESSLQSALYVVTFDLRLCWPSM